MKGITVPEPPRRHGLPVPGLTASTQFRTLRGWDLAVVATILVAVLLGWFTAADGNDAGAPRPAHCVAHAWRLSRQPPVHDRGDGRACEFRG